MEMGVHKRVYRVAPRDLDLRVSLPRPGATHGLGTVVLKTGADPYSLSPRSAAGSMLQTRKAFVPTPSSPLCLRQA